MNVVFGATGRLGGAAVAALRERGMPVRAVVRDAARGAALVAQGCEVVVADVYDRGANARAMAGASRALVIVPLAAGAADLIADAGAIIEATAAAIEDARPGAVVAISDYGAHHASGTGITMIFRALEDRFALTGVPTIFLRSAEHLQNWRRQAGPARKRGMIGSLHHPVDRAFPSVAAQDVGRIAADLLALPARDGVVHAEGPRRISANDVAIALAGIVGREVTAQAVPRDQWTAVLTAAGLGEGYARLVCELQDAHNAGRIDVEPGGEVRLGTTELADALAGELRQA